MEFKIFKKRKPTKREICPLCNKGYKEERYNSRNELVFYGCTNFPECKYKEKIKTNTKYYIDILIDGYESIFTYKCNKNFILKKGNTIYLKDKYGATKATIVKEKYLDNTKDNKWYNELIIVSPDYKPLPKKYIDVRFESVTGKYFNKTCYTYICPDNFKYKEGDIITVISKYGESNVLITKEPYIDIEKDRSSFYKELTIIEEEH